MFLYSFGVYSGTQSFNGIWQKEFLICIETMVGIKYTDEDSSRACGAHVGLDNFRYYNPACLTHSRGTSE